MRNYLYSTTSLKVASIVGGAALLAATVGQASADTVSFAFASPGNPLGNSQSYTSTFSPGGQTASITATGFDKQSTRYQTNETALYYNDSSTVETGLGLKDGPPTHEIGYGQFVQLDLSSLLPMLPSGDNSLVVTIGSVQQESGDAFKIYSSGTAGKLGSSVVASGNWKTSPADGLATVTISTADLTGNFLDVAETGYTGHLNCDSFSSGSVLLNNLTVNTGSPLPEPASLAMMGAMGLGILLLPRKKHLRA